MDLWKAKTKIGANFQSEKTFCPNLVICGLSFSARKLTLTWMLLNVVWNPLTMDQRVRIDVS